MSKNENLISLDFDETTFDKRIIKVIGVGSSGSIAVSKMMEYCIKDLEYIIVDSDKTVLEKSSVPTKILLDLSQKNEDELKDIIENTDLLFLVTGLGGKTGAEGLDFIFKIADDLNLFTITVVTLPYDFEDKQKIENANNYINNNIKNDNPFIIIPLQKYFNPDNDFNKNNCFNYADTILRQCVEFISNTIIIDGIIGVDLLDVKAVLQNGGESIYLYGISEGKNKNAVEATKTMLNNTVINSSELKKAKGLLLVFTIGGEFISLEEIDKATNIIEAAVSENTHIILSIFDIPNFVEQFLISTIFTGVKFKN